MKRIDYHMHTYFSTDSEANPRNHIISAISMGLDEICFTEHKDFNYPYCAFDLDVGAYFLELRNLQEEFKNQIIIKIGLEIGLDTDYLDEINSFVEFYPFDYVIGSIHVIHQTEFYDPADFFVNKTKEQAHKEFFLETLKCVKAFDCFNCLGHLDYICRYGPYDDKSVKHELYQDIIDEILKTLIQKNKGIEVNTSGYNTRGDCGFPDFRQVKRYFDLGGSIITVGTDSHTSNRVGENIENVINEYKKIGFQDVSTFTKRVRD